MRKNLLNALAGTSLLLCVALLILWPLSYWQWNSIQLTATPQSRLTEIAVYEGQVTVGYLWGSPLPTHGVFRVLSNSTQYPSMDALWGLISSAPTCIGPRCGPAIHFGSWGGMYSGFSRWIIGINVPAWLVVVLLAIYPWIRFSIWPAGRPTNRPA